MIPIADVRRAVTTEPLCHAPPHAAPEAEPTAALPSPDVVSTDDPTTMIAKLFVKSAQQKRTSDHLSATAAERAEDAADAKRIEAMKTKADRTFAAGMVGGLSQAASGACSLSGGILSARALNAPAPALLPPGVSGPADMRPALAQSISARYGGAADAAGGGGKVAEALLKRSADREDEHIATAETESKVARRAQEALHKEVEAATQHEGKVLQLLQEIRQAQAQCEHAALLRM